MKRPRKQYWRCSVRSQEQCPASVIQSGEDFRPGMHSHIHEKTDNVDIDVEVRAKAKSMAKEQVSNANVLTKFWLL